MSGQMERTIKTETSWKLNAGIEEWVCSTSKVSEDHKWSYYWYQNYSLQARYGHDLKYEQDLNWTEETTTNTEGTSTIYTGTGSASGTFNEAIPESLNNSRKFSGKISRDGESGIFSASATATASTWSSIPESNFLSHGEIAIDYLGFAGLRYRDGVIVDTTSERPAVLSTPSTSLNCQLGVTSVSLSNPGLTFDATGVGVAFGEPMEIPAGFFDSGIDRFLTEQETPEYVPMPMEGFTPVDPEVASILCQLCGDSGKVMKQVPVIVNHDPIYGTLTELEWKTIHEVCTCQYVYGNLMGEGTNAKVLIGYGLLAGVYHYYAGMNNNNCDDAIADMVKHLNTLKIDMDADVAGKGPGYLGGTHGIHDVSPCSHDVIGASGMGPCIGVVIYSELEGLRAAFHFTQGDDAATTLARYKWPADCRAIIAGATPGNYPAKSQLNEVLRFMWWHNIPIDGYTATNEVRGIYVDRDGNWIVVPNKDYIKAHRPDMILPEISE